ncbi:MAG: GatB/YqeY domain-containing protein, partial [Thermomicrobiales bacterium]|nr:GatB/YqeY domain-containing protein [Thermomicrobiales bacterium]
DLANREGAQLAVLKRYLPEELSDDELQALVDRAIVETGASSPRDMGKVMPVVLREAAGRADGRRVSDAVKAALAR